MLSLLFIMSTAPFYSVVVIASRNSPAVSACYGFTTATDCQRLEVVAV